MKRVLVAEDDPVFRRVIEFTLSRAGFEVLTAQNGHDAFERLKITEIDCLVTDQQMPRLTGIELIGRVRDCERYKDLPIILCTAKGLELDSEFLSQRYNLFAVLHKPFSPQHLGQLLKGCCSASGTTLPASAV